MSIRFNSLFRFGVFPWLAVALVILAGCVQEVERPETPAAGTGPQETIAAAPTRPPEPAPTIATPGPPPAAGPTATARPTTPSPTAAPPPPTAFLPPPGLVLEITGPSDGTKVSTNVVVVHGQTSPGALIAINDDRVAVDRDGRFQEEVGLSPGVNTIQVVAVDSQGNREIREFTVTSQVLPPQPFLLLVTEPQDQSVLSQENIRLSGRTGPEAVVSVNGVSVSVDRVGIFSTMVNLNPGPNIIDVVATNDDGQVLSTVVAVIYRQR